MEEYGADYVTITDEDGINYEMEILSRFPYENAEYLALVPAEEEDEASSASLEVSILRIVEESGEELLEAVTDEAELQGAYDALMELLYAEEIEEDEE